MLTLIRMLSFAGIIAAPLLYLIKSRLDGVTVGRLFNISNLAIRWGIVFAASLFSPLAFRIVTGIVAGWTIFCRTGMILNSFKSDPPGLASLSYGTLAPYYLSSLSWIALFVMSFL